MASGVHAATATHGLLLSLNAAITACGKSSTDTLQLRAMAGIPELQPYTAPPTQAQPLAAQSPGAPCMPLLMIMFFVALQGNRLHKMS